MSGGISLFQQAKVDLNMSKTDNPTRIIVGLSGASGAIYGVRVLERLKVNPAVETHLVLTRAGEKTLFLETGEKAAFLKALAHYSWSPEDIAAPLASGSFQTAGMVVAPCSIHTMSSICSGTSADLISRAADVVLKERRRLILMVRETPLHLGHLRTMTALTEMGAIIAPPVPGFYNNPSTIQDLVDSSVDRVLDLLGLPDPAIRRWNGPAGYKRVTEISSHSPKSHSEPSKFAPAADEETN